MAGGLPVITIPCPPLTAIVRAGEEGLHVKEADPGALADAIAGLAADGARRAAMGKRARARVVERYSWACHCEQLERVLARIAA
jgi:glycosyltransferase involved in cell wall biosynthesis